MKSNKNKARKEYIISRALTIGNYIKNSGSTIREVAKMMNISKSTVHRDIRLILPEINPILSAEVDTVLTNNFNTKHIRGRHSVKHKFLTLK